MVNCSYCGGVLDKRLVFCSPSHKVLYHRKKGTPQEKVAVSNVPKKNQKKLDKSGYCPHFIQEAGYCRSCEE